jgi:hypothetical protein
MARSGHRQPPGTSRAASKSLELGTTIRDTRSDLGTPGRCAPSSRPCPEIHWTPVAGWPLLPLLASLASPDPLRVAGHGSHPGTPGSGTTSFMAIHVQKFNRRPRHTRPRRIAMNALELCGRECCFHGTFQNHLPSDKGKTNRTLNVGMVHFGARDPIKSRDNHESKRRTDRPA